MPDGQVIKLVNATSLDNGLTSIADAIRTKGETSADLAFPEGFVDAVEAIPTGGTSDPVQMIVDGVNTSGHVVSDYVFTAKNNLFKTVLWTSACLKNMLSAAYATNMQNIFNGVTTLQSIVLPSITLLGQEVFRDCSNLVSVDFGPSFNSFGTNMFYGCNRWNLLVLRNTNQVPLSNTNNFTNANAWKSGGTGGTIYIPKVLYDHLGDGGSLDYKAASNWSTIDGYGTITWAQIEGSIYETQYADGTPIT